MKIATSLYDFSGICKDEFERIKAASETKFKYYNIGGMYYGAPSVFEEDEATFFDYVEKIGRACEESGIKIIMAHSPNLALKTEEEFEASVAMAKRRIRACAMLGCPDLVQHCFGTSKYTPTLFYRENKRFFERLFDDMEKYNIHVLTENMDYCANYPLSTGHEMRKFIDFVDHPLFGACWDVAHANTNSKTKYASQYDSIMEMGDKLRGLHISDNYGDGAHHHTFPFEGTINWDEIMLGLRDSGYKGYFTYEATYALRCGNSVPEKRRIFEKDGVEIKKLHNPPLWLKQEADNLLYDIAQYLLEQYDLFEE